MHLEQLVEVADIHARAGGDALLAAGLQKCRVGPLLLGHRVDQRDLLAQDLVVETGLVHLGLHLAHARHHAHDAFHAAHLHHLLKLLAQVVHVELTLLEALHHALGLFGLQRLLRLLDQRDDVAHAQDPARDPLRFEGLDGVHLLAEADEADRLAGDRAHRQRRAAATVAVHPGQDNAGDADLVVEFGGDVHRVLACQAVDHQQRLARVGHVANGGGLGDQFLVDMQAPCGVQHVDVIAAQAGLRLCAPGNRDRVFALDDRQRVDTDLLAEDRQLLHCRRAVGVERGHQHPLALAFLQPLGQLGGRRRLARALQAHHQDRRGRVVDLERAGILVTLQHMDQLVMNDLDHLLTRGDRFGHGLAGGLVLHGLDEIPRDGQ